MAFEYPHAGKNAQPEVKEAVQRFKGLSKYYIEMKSKVNLSKWLLGNLDDYKMAPEDARYTDLSMASAQRCANCEHICLKMSTRSHICSEISGNISPDGWCNQWKKPDDS